MSEATKAATGAGARTEHSSLLDSILDQATPTGDASQRAGMRTALSELIKEAVKSQELHDRDTEKLIKKRIGELDALISKQLNAIMHAPEFQKLEASWRGLKFLVDQTPNRADLKIKVLNASKDELYSDLTGARGYDQSALWKKVYNDEFDQFGGTPFGVLVGDYEFSHSHQDVTLLEKMAEVAAASHAPFISAASAKMFGIDSYTQIGEPTRIDDIFQQVAYAKWRSFRDSDDSKYVGLTGPRMLLRLPYSAESPEVKTITFREEAGGLSHNEYLWGNSAYAFASRITSAFGEYGWCTTIRGPQGGGMVTGLPTHTFATDEGDVAMKCPTEVSVAGRRQHELENAGFIPLIHCKGTDYAAFFAAQSVNKPATYNKPEATANARLSSQLQYMLATCRFAHYMQSMMRDRIGSFMSRSEAETFLQTWIADYVLDTDSGSAEQKAKRPLRSAQIQVEEVPGKPGAYRAVAFLRPHFQLEEIDISLRLVAELPKQRANG